MTVIYKWLKEVHRYAIITNVLERKCILLKKTLCAVALSLAAAAALTFSAQPAQAADPVYYVAAPQQSDWHQVTVDQPVVNPRRFDVFADAVGF